MVKKRIVAKPEVCMGCHLCEVWCVVAHSKSKDIIKAFLYEQPRAQPRIIIEEELPETFALQCRHCDEPKCVAACIAGAMYKGDDGVVLHDESKCVACYSCIMACPYGAITINVETKKPLKCDLCTGLDYPYCVKMCPNNALELVVEAEEFV